MNKFNELSNRGAVPVYAKMKPKPEASHLVNYKKQKEYEYYKCDYCGAEIKILEKRQEMTGGIVTMPYTITRKKEINLALCNKCLKPALKEFEKEEVI
jgi:hypothetical protein